jgi:hypothetical protein
MVPAGNHGALCDVFNWIAKHGFKLLLVNIGYIQNNSNIASPGKQTVTPMNLVYCTTDHVTFKRYFNFNYDVEQLHTLPEIIAKKENEKKALHTGHG